MERAQREREAWGREKVRGREIATGEAEAQQRATDVWEQEILRGRPFVSDPMSEEARRQETVRRLAETIRRVNERDALALERGRDALALEQGARQAVIPPIPPITPTGNVQVDATYLARLQRDNVRLGELLRSQLERQRIPEPRAAWPPPPAQQRLEEDPDPTPLCRRKRSFEAC